MDFIERIDGIALRRPMAVRFKSADGSVEFSPPRMELHGKLKRTQCLTGDDFAELKAARRRGRADRRNSRSRRRRCCISAAAAPRIAPRRSIRTSTSSIADIARVYREEIAALYDAGCRYLQIDETNLPSLCDPKLREQAKNDRRGPGRRCRALRAADQRRAARPAGGHDRRACTCAAAITQAAGSPKAATIRWPRCCSARSTSTASSSNTTAPRAGSFAPLRYLPARARSRCSASSPPRRPKLESKDELKRRIEEAAKYVPLERLALSPQCGFASTIEGNRAHRGRREAQARARRRDRARGLGLTGTPPTVIRNPWSCPAAPRVVRARLSCQKARRTGLHDGRKAAARQRRRRA